jgi:hypothetical protein
MMISQRNVVTADAQCGVAHESVAVDARVLERAALTVAELDVAVGERVAEAHESVPEVLTELLGASDPQRCALRPRLLLQRGKGRVDGAQPGPADGV